MSADSCTSSSSSATPTLLDPLDNFCIPNGPKDQEDFAITLTEFEQFKEALKKEEFRKLLVEYVEGIQNPENQKIYQSEVRELERQNGKQVHFLNPIPGYVLKTSVNGEKKGFINICSNPLIKKASVENGQQGDNAGLLWSIPYAQSPPREDVDKAGAFCLVYDVIFNPDSIKGAEANSALKARIEEIALDAVEQSFKMTLDRTNLKRPKLQYKGMPRATVIRYKIGEPLPSIIDPTAIDQEVPPMTVQTPNPNLNMKENLYREWKKQSVERGTKSNEKIEPVFAESDDDGTIPRYSLKYRSHVDLQDCCIDNQRSGKSSKPIPDEIILTIDLPLLRDSSALEADVLQDGWNFELKSTRKAKYDLKLKLPFQVYPDTANAKFEKDTRKLHIIMKTIQVKKPVEVSLPRQYSDDAGVFEDDSSSDASFSSGSGEPRATKVKLVEMINEKPGETDIGYESTESMENIPPPTIINGNVVVKSILKGSTHKNPRCRSMSESWIEHMDHLQKEEFESLESLSESNELLSEASSSLNEKSVRFSDSVQQQLYRSNSSILGQRKKNQRKNKSKRKSRERHNSEGSASSYDGQDDEGQDDDPHSSNSFIGSECKNQIFSTKSKKPCKSMSLE